MSSVGAPASGRPRQLRRRREIMDAAADIFARKGYHAATTRDIADRLGMQPGSLYYYIESKEAALEEICRIGGAEFGDNLETVLASGKPAAAMIRDAIGHHLQSDRRHYVTCFAHNRRFLPEAVLPEMNRMARRYTKLWEDLFRIGAERGELRAGLDVRLAATGAVAMCNGAVAYLEPKAPDEIGRFVDGLAALIHDGVARR
ncbi:MAG: TetR/AcrR family transcriptional regulator [Rhodospirillaceae bacterium]|nr:TetR/AcrR family transcriptional regulator [Rhodospirillaceae bacterium]